MTTPDQTPVPPPPIASIRPTAVAVVSIISLVTAGGLGTLQLFWPGKASSVPGIFGTVSSWISAGGIMGILSLLVWFVLGSRKIKVDEMRVEVADDHDLRDHYATELRSYADEVKALRRELTNQRLRHSRELRVVERRYRESDERHEKCQKEVTSLREEVRGMKDQIRLQASDRVIALERSGEEPSGSVSGSARRVKRIVKNKPGGADTGSAS